MTVLSEKFFDPKAVSSAMTVLKSAVIPPFRHTVSQLGVQLVTSGSVKLMVSCPASVGSSPVGFTACAVMSTGVPLVVSAMAVARVAQEPVAEVVGSTDASCDCEESHVQP